jgi:hypothetical protein
MACLAADKSANRKATQPEAEANKTLTRDIRGKDEAA